MTESAPQEPKGNLLLGFLGITAIPWLILADSAVAVSRGWSPASAGTIGLLVYAAAGFPLLVLLALVVGPFRRLLRGRATSVWIFSVSLLVAWGLADVALDVAVKLPPFHPFHRRTPSAKYQFEPDPYTMPGVFGKATYTTNSLGIRGPELPDRSEAYRILCVGGGATECIFIDDQKTWTHRLMAGLNESADKPVWVGSAGIIDFTSSDHLKFLRCSEVPRQMDCLVLLVGANDLARYVMGLPLASDAGPLWYRSKLFNTLKYTWNAVLQKGYYVDRTGQHLTLLRLGRHIPPHPLDLPKRAAEYKERLRAIATAAKQHHVRLVLVTHPVLWDYFLTTQGSKRLWLARVTPYPRKWDFLNSADLVDAIELYNDALIQVAQEEGVESIDAASRMNGNEMFFYDDFHFNHRGSKAFADILLDYFRQHPAAASR